MKRSRDERHISWMNIRGKRRRWVAVAVFAAVLAGIAVTFLMAQHRPGWYRPATLTLTDENAMRTVRRDATNTFDAFGDRIVEGKRFEFELTEQAVNQVLAALPQLWPEAAGSIPRELADLAVSFGNGWARIGAMVSTSNWQAIGGVALAVTVVEDGAKLKLALVGASCGSLPLPRAILEPALNRSLKRPPPKSADAEFESIELGSVVESAAQLYEGITIPNRFTWPNGERRFRLKAIQFSPGKMRLEIEPLR